MHLLSMVGVAHYPRMLGLTRGCCVCRWDAYLFRNEDSFGEQAAEQAAKDALQQQEAADLAREQDDSMSMSLLPLPLRSVAKGSSARHAGQRLGDRETMAALQRLAVQEGVASLGDEPWTKYNESTLTPLIPTTVRASEYQICHWPQEAWHICRSAVGAALHISS